MKADALDCPKMHELAEALDVPMYAARGIMESLWKWAAKNATDGAIGKWSNRAIARGVDWDREADELIDALVKVRFVDAHETHRLVIHDWHQHAEDSVHLALARATRVFWNGAKPKTTRLSKNERADVEAAYAEQPAHAQHTHDERAPSTPRSTLPSHPKPSPSIPPPPPSKPAPSLAERGDGGGGCAAKFLGLKPAWLPPGQSWFDEDAAADVSKGRTIDELDAALSLVKAQKAGSTNPAGLLVHKLKSLTPDSVERHVLARSKSQGRTEEFQRRLAQAGGAQ